MDHIYCHCEQQTCFIVKVEADVGADPLWCQRCGYNLDIDQITLSMGVKKELMKWTQQYGEWIDWKADKLVENGVEWEEKHNIQGEILTERVNKELGAGYKVVFSPASIASSYEKK
ncbi:Uncharacterised protein [Mycobacteroides abscessus subsp. abscessus]|nr:Uncharacterised protein [Mycobacteroides abscessus subsp. abscessus]